MENNNYKYSFHFYLKGNDGFVLKKFLADYKLYKGKVNDFFKTACFDKVKQLQDRNIINK